MMGLDAQIEIALHREAAQVSSAIRDALGGLVSAPPRLREAMIYSLEAGGKRLRPVLTIWCAELCGGERSIAMPAAVAIECVHTFSLVHDDLPAIDNDDLRRGRPTNHRVYGEATAILSGDALLAFAFEWIASKVRSSDIAAKMVLELANATGASGMIGGEFDDIEGESQPAERDRVAAIHDAKTARLIQCACRLGAIAAGAETDDFAALSEYGRQLGLAFQIADDLLDETGTTESVGKRTGKDVNAGKQTYPRVLGIEATRKLGVETAHNAVAALKKFGSSANKLVALANFVMERNS